MRIKGHTEADVQVSLGPGKVLSEGSLSFLLPLTTTGRFGIALGTPFPT